MPTISNAIQLGRASSLGAAGKLFTKTNMLQLRGTMLLSTQPPVVYQMSGWDSVEGVTLYWRTTVPSAAPAPTVPAGIGAISNIQIVAVLP